MLNIFRIFVSRSRKFLSQIFDAGDEPGFFYFNPFGKITHIFQNAVNSLAFFSRSSDSKEAK